MSLIETVKHNFLENKFPKNKAPHCLMTSPSKLKMLKCNTCTWRKMCEHDPI